ncbi:TSUP family transporter [Pseudoflavitalea sp. X16]|uniref:sulfite exporter TauE/SafE family protein n=1 Tax=Paraflavitalea devenefica TaxID=2716334 RepID=UPI0014231FB7|nr:TSUP family transporter [Paraflavitalea devenefica]NII28935.1 TSUP family transporter [Paraflavitalea devenefica]
MTTDLIFLCIAAFLAGFVDAIVGGGGLIQTPVGLVLLPQYPVATVLGTLKIPAFSGTSFAAIQYARMVKLDYKRLAAMTTIAFCAAVAGSRLLTIVSSSFMKPVLLLILIGVAIYTYTKKNFGVHTEKDHSDSQQWWYAAGISLVIGFYDGFIGPGAGSFLILAFVTLLGFDFLKASAHAKFVNLATNLGSIIFFAISGKIIYAIALPMALCNALGGFAGARFAILKGNAFIRILFLVVVCGTILRFAYDIFFK